MQNHYLSFLCFIFAMACNHAHAAPLGTIPTIEDRGLRLIFDFKSDMWTSPYTYKSAPVRVIGGEFRIPIAHAADWKMSVDIADEGLSLGRSDLTLGKKKVFVGSDLRSQSVGFGLNKDFADGASITFFGAFASASDKPHGSDRDEWVEGTAIYRAPPVGNHMWLFAVTQSNNQGFFNNEPFVFFGVNYRPDSEFQAVFGFPFLRLVWGTPETWKKEFSLTPFGARFSLDTDLEDEFEFNSFAGFSVRSYLHDARTDDDDRLYFQQFEVEASVKKNMTPATGITFGLGYSFDRRLYESETIYSPNSEVTVIDNDLYGRVSVEFRL